MHCRARHSMGGRPSWDSRVCSVGTPSRSADFCAMIYVIFNSRFNLSASKISL